MSEQSLTLKWGTIKGWNGITEGTPAREALERYHAESVSMDVMQQNDTDAQTQALCDLIDAIVGEIYNDWSGENMTKDEAKKYVREYRQ